jgi:hypothetical protein
MAQKRVVTLAIPPATTMTPPPRLSAITSISVPDLVSSLKRSAAGEHPCEQQRGGGGGRGREEAPVEYAVLMIGSEQKRPLASDFYLFLLFL